jgi:hypothetical protein
MKLKDKYLQPPIVGLPASWREWWDIGDGYEIYVAKGCKEFSLGIYAPDPKDITFNIAAILGVDTSVENLVKMNKSNEELYLSMGIDCVVLNTKNPEKYMELLDKIEKIVNEKFKNK